LVVVLGIFVFAISLVWIIPEYQGSLLPDDIGAKEIAILKDAYRKTVVQVVGGSVVFLGLYLTWRRISALEKQVQVTEDGQITTRFTEAIKLLSAKDLPSRLGGIYSLERIAKDSEEKDHWTIMEVLTGFICAYPQSPTTDRRFLSGTCGPLFWVHGALRATWSSCRRGA